MTILYSTELNVDVEIELDELSDDELRDCLKEAERRGITIRDFYEREYVEEARCELVGGRYRSALALVERALEPVIPKSTREAYDKLMAEAHRAVVKPLEEA